MRIILNTRLMKFVVVGVLNTAFSFSIYSLLLYLGLGYFSAYCISVILGLLFSFKTHGRFVFNNPDRRLLPRYAACWVAVFIANLSMIALLVHIGINAYWSGAVALAPSIAFSYLLQRFLVFRGGASGRSP